MKVKLKNVGVIDSCDVEFIPGINLIVGSSGSGKSTLLRSIHNIAVNEFSDSDISFGKESMHISIVCDDNTIEYSRFTKPKEDKFYYVVNGEKYSKVGRQSLSAANDILKLGDIDINGDSINFNFNMQFSMPFLIFGSQSTLYNVLTYRSQFDISKINDCYNVDVKSNNNEINTTLKVRDQLNESLTGLRVQESKLQPVEDLYSKYTTYKHMNSCLSEISDLFCKLQLIGLCEARLDDLNRIVSNVEISLYRFESLIDICRCGEHLHSVKKLSEFINKSIAIDNSYSCAKSLYSELNDVALLNTMMKKCNKILSDLEILHSSIVKAEFLLDKSSFISDIVEYSDKIALRDKLCKLIGEISRLDQVDITSIDDAIIAHKSIVSLLATNRELYVINNKCSEINDELSSFKVCPLCGSYLHSENSHADTQTSL
jgi:ABC-type dipeptide/oligopeptide/nickel transport system ATPase component